MNELVHLDRRIIIIFLIYYYTIIPSIILFITNVHCTSLTYSDRSDKNRDWDMIHTTEITHIGMFIQIKIKILCKVK